jgi:hypothetical protein
MNCHVGNRRKAQVNKREIKLLVHLSQQRTAPFVAIPSRSTISAAAIRAMAATRSCERLVQPYSLPASNSLAFNSPARLMVAASVLPSR